MKKILHKKLFILISALSFIGSAWVWACAFSDWDEYEISVFAPEPFADSAFKPFFFAPNSLFYDEYFYSASLDYKFNEDNIKDWSGYFKHQINDSVLNYLLHTAPITSIDSMLEKKVTSSSSLYPYIKPFKQVEPATAQNFLNYLHFAKQNENYALSEKNVWEYNTPSKDSINGMESVKNINDMLSNYKMFTQDNFLAQRYFFQLCRAYYFSKQYNKAIEFYNTNAAQFPQNIIQMRSLGYVAAAYHKLKKFPQANLLYAQLYDYSNTFKKIAAFSFHPQNEKEWQQSLALATSKKEKIALWHMLGIYYDELRAMKAIYELDPMSDKLDLLLTRYINIQEYKLNNSYPETIQYVRDSFNQEGYTWIKNLADKGKIAKPYFWNLAAGYLAFLNQQYPLASHYLNNSISTMPNDEAMKGLCAQIQAMNYIGSVNEINANNETQISKSINYLLDSCTFKNARTYYAKFWAKKVLAKKYLNQKDTLRAELWDPQENYYGSNSLLLAMQTFLKNKKFNALDKIALANYPVHLEDIYQYQAVQATYNNDISNAITLLQQAKGLDTLTLLGNPFNGKIKDCNDCDHQAPTLVQYTKMHFLIKIQEMKDKLEHKTDVYNNALLLGNAFYNLSYFGNARLYYEGTILSCCHSNPNMLPTFFKAQALDMKWVKYYYTMALQAAQTPEQKAKVTYLLLKVERNEVYQKWFQSPSYDPWEFAEIPKLSFQNLNPYKNTAFYKEVIKECGYFRNYLSKH